MEVEQTAFINAPVLDLESALDEVIRTRAISPKRLPRVRAALAAFSRLTGKPPAELPAQRGFVIRKLRSLRQRPVKVSLKTLSNTRSELLFLIASVGGREIGQMPLAYGWDLLRERFARNPFWWGLSRFAAYASRNKIRPQDINDTHVRRFGEMLTASEELDRPLWTVRQTVRQWNKLGVLHPDLQLRALTLARRQLPRWTLPESEFSKSFRDDVDAWLARLIRPDEMTDGPARGLRPATIRLRRHQMFKAASALVFSGMSVEAVKSLADLVKIENFQALMRHLLARQGGSTEALHGLAGGLLAVARHHVRVAIETDAKLARLVRNLDHEVVGFRSRTRKRLAAFEEDQVLAKLFRLPDQLLIAAKQAKSSRARKHLAQVAIAIEILTFAPLRVGNLASLRLGETLRQLRIRNTDCWLISISATNVKNRQELIHELPAKQHPLIAEALRLYAQPEGWVFAGRRSCSKGASLLSSQIKKVVQRHLSVEFHTHMFRALAGYVHLRENPNGFETVRALLGNRDEHVVRNNYAFMAERSQIAHAQQTIRDSRARFISPVGLPKRRRG